jgi:hypothetical protein
MRRLPKAAKSLVSESSKYRKKKSKKANWKNVDVNIDEWAFLEWASDDNSAILVENNSF